MRILHQFLKSQLTKIYAMITLVVMAFTSLPSSAQGLYQSFENLLDIQKTNYDKKVNQLSKKTINLNRIENLDEVELDNDFINTILFYSPSRYSSLAYKDKCSFYDLFLAGHIKGPDGALNNFIIAYKTKKGEIKKSVIKAETFIERIAFEQCPQSKKFHDYFTLKNLNKTAKTITLKTPTTEEDCFEIHQQYLDDYKTPYLCKMHEYIDDIPKLTRLSKNLSKARYRELQQIKKKLRIARRYEKVLNENSIDFLKNLCENIEKPKIFCNSFFNVNFWKKIVKGEKSPRYIEHKCLAHLNKRTLTKRRIKRCARDFTSTPDLCHYLNSQDMALAPRQNCETQSFALNRSRLFSDYLDCPSKTGNEGITNISRVIKHIDPKIKNTRGSSCEIDAINTFVEFNNEASDGRFWGQQLCFENKIMQREECFPTLLGDSPGSEYSISTVINNILKKTRGYNSAKGCEFITSREYKPLLLKYRAGCYIIADKENCYGTDCRFKIILDESEMKHIILKKGTMFDYFPSNYLEENMAQTKLAERFYKKKTRKILNISFLKTVLNQHPNAIIQGIACAEDLLPTHFIKNTLHKCTPLPFIVDGYTENSGSLSLILRTAIDDVHSPRVISWSYAFSALKAYKALHPLDLWGLYAIY